MKQNQGRFTIIFGLLLLTLLITGCSGSDNSAPADDGQVTEDSLNSADFSGVWEGRVLIDEVRNMEEYKNLEDAVFFCELVLELDAEGNGVADLYLDGELAGRWLDDRSVSDRGMGSGW